MDSQKLWREKYLPLLSRAKRISNNQNIYSWLDECETICGVEVVHFTPLIMLRLEAVGNRFICGGSVEYDDILQFLWAISKDYKENKQAGDKFYKKWGRKLKFSELYDDIKKYLEVQISSEDVIERELEGIDYDKVDSKSDPSVKYWISSLVDALASQYGWTVEYILNMPISQIKQLQDRITDRLNPSKIQFDTITCRIQASYLKEIRNLK